MTPELINLARATVMTKAAFWDALRALETATASNPYNDGDWSDHINDKVIQMVNSLAAFTSEIEPIADEDLVDLISLAQS
jgi:hypothetical protein